MNVSICSADETTHLNILATALAAAIAVVWIGLAARISSDANSVRVATSLVIRKAEHFEPDQGRSESSRYTDNDPSTEVRHVSAGEYPNEDG